MHIESKQVYNMTSFVNMFSFVLSSFLSVVFSMCLQLELNAK